MSFRPSTAAPSTRGRPQRALACAVLAVIAVLVGSLVGSAAPSAAAPAAPGENGRIAYVSAWAEDVLGEVFRVNVASGKRTNVSKSPTHEEHGPLVSPDGRTILSTRGIEIWAMDADGSGKRHINVGWTPAWSPDGRRIAFERDENVMTMMASGSDVRRVARGRAPAWSPAGGALAWIDDRSLRVAAPDGSSPRTVLSTTTFISSPTWSPDGTRIAIGAEVLLESGAVFNGLVVVPRGGGEVRRLASVPAGEALFQLDPRWSPDGARLAFVRGRQVVTARVDNGAVVTLTRPGAGVADTRPAWSPDGRFVAFVRGARDVLVVPSSGGRARAVVREDAHARMWEEDWLSWMPDGRSLVYSRELQDNDSNIFTVQPGDVGRRRLTSHDANDWAPAFSPDGRWIAFVRTLRRGRDAFNNELFVMRADGTGVRRLTRNPADDHGPAWSPDGSRIVFAREPSLYTVRPDGTGLTRLRVPRSTYGTPSWSAHRDAIVVPRWDNCPGEGATLRILRLRAAKAAASRDAHVGRAGQPEWSPDGRRISFVEPCENDYYESSSVWTMQLDRAPQVLAAGGTDATWSPDGRHLAVTGPWLRSTLAIVSSDGRRERALTTALQAQPDLSWQPLCTLRGSERADVLRAGPAAARACGNGGRDTIRGGPASDRLFGGAGDDSIDARGGGFDIVGCGAGRDRVRADRGDYVGDDCEHETVR